MESEKKQELEVTVVPRDTLEKEKKQKQEEAEKRQQKRQRK